MNDLALILPVFIGLVLLILGFRLAVFLLDTIADMVNRPQLPYETRLTRGGFAILLVGALFFVGTLVVRGLFSW